MKNLNLCRPDTALGFAERRIIISRLRLRWGWLAFLTLAAVLALPAPLRAAEKAVRINLGTLAPRGSSYHQSLQAMAERWKQIPGGGVRLVIYPDGTQGGETDMVRLMRVGSLHAGLLTAVGLADIEPGVTGLQTMPMMFRNFDEFEFVNDKLRPILEKRLAEKGFVVLFWVDAGWVRYFSKEPMLTPDDMRKRKVFVWAGNTAQVDIMKKHVGACVIKKETWEKISAEAHEAMLKSAAEAGKEIRANSRKESDESVAAMKKRGLNVHEPTPEQEAKWRAGAEEIYPDIRGRIVPADIFDEVQRLLKVYRAGGGKK